MSKVSFKKTALLLLAMSASFGAAAYDSSYLSVVKDDAGVQEVHPMEDVVSEQGAQ